VITIVLIVAIVTVNDGCNAVFIYSPVNVPICSSVMLFCSVPSAYHDITVTIYWICCDVALVFVFILCYSKVSIRGFVYCFVMTHL